MSTLNEFDAVVVGSGPNGLSAGVLLAQQGLKVKIIEAKDTIGGGTRTKELTEPGFLHDVCSSVHPTGIGSPYLKTLPLDEYGLEWIHPEIPVAHPFDDGDAFLAFKSLDQTIEQAGKDGKHYRNLIEDFVKTWDSLSHDLFAPIRIPNNPLSMARFGWFGMMSARLLANSMFDEKRTRGFFAGLAGHSILPLSKAFTGSFGLVFATSIHAVGWPVAKGGSASITNALAKYFESLGGVIETGNEVTDIESITESEVVLFDLTPKQIEKIAGSELPLPFRSKLLSYKYGPGTFKMDFALSEPVPWKNEGCRKAGTVHLGSTLEEITHSEAEVWKGNHPEKPYVLVTQQSLFDSTRAPEGKHTLWAYCHVPNGSDKDCSEEIIAQIERYAPGFRDTIISSHSMNAAQFESYNPNYIGGDINGGAQFFRQLIARPVMRWDPYRLPTKGLYICSSSTPPGGGVHGMCGYHAAKSALKNEFDIKV